MGSHYIQVGKLKVDSDLLDIVCPAAGYSETPPDPAIYCPANGYSAPESTYVPDEAIPYTDISFGTEQIVLICSDQAGGLVDLVVYGDTGFSYEIYGNGGTLIENGTHSNGNISLDFSHMTGGYPSADGHNYYKIVFRPYTDENIRKFTVKTYTTLYPIIEAYLNCPEIEEFHFNGCKLLRKVWMCDSMDKLNCPSSYKVFQNTLLLEEITMPSSMAIQTNMDYWFAYSNVRNVVLPAYMPSCTSIQYLFYYSKVKTVTLPTTAEITEYMTRSFAYCPNLTEIIFTNGFSLSSGTIYCNTTFSNSTNIEKIDFADLKIGSGNTLVGDLPKLQFPDGHAQVEITSDCTAFYRFFNGDILIRKITITGNGSNMTANEMNGFSNMPLLEEITYPNYIPKVYNSLITNDPSLRKVTLSESMPNLVTDSYIDKLWCSVSTKNVEEVSTCNDWGTNQLMFSSNYCRKLKILNQPTVRLSSFVASGTSSAPRSLEYIEIDWANSTCTQYQIAYNNLSATEIDRIFTALPTVETGSIYINGNPGADLCDPTIAEAKGWTVS